MAEGNKLKKEYSMSLIKVRDESIEKYYSSKITRTIFFTEKGRKKYGVSCISETTERDDIIDTSPTLYKTVISKEKTFIIFEMKVDLEKRVIKSGLNTFTINSIRKETIKSGLKVYILKILNIYFPVVSDKRYIVPLLRIDIEELIEKEYYIVNQRGLIVNHNLRPEMKVGEMDKCYLLIPENWFLNVDEIEKHLFD